MEALGSEGIWLFHYSEPREGDPWSTQITISINLGDTDLKREIDLSLLKGNLLNPSEIRLAPEGLVSVTSFL